MCLVYSLPGQSCVLHFSSTFPLPSHLLPLSFAHIFLLVFVLVPPPHAMEHEPISQVLHSQYMGSAKFECIKDLNELCFDSRRDFCIFLFGVLLKTKVTWDIAEYVIITRAVIDIIIGISIRQCSFSLAQIIVWQRVWTFRQITSWLCIVSARALVSWYSNEIPNTYGKNRPNLQITAFQNIWKSFKIICESRHSYA